MAWPGRHADQRSSCTHVTAFIINGRPALALATLVDRSPAQDRVNLITVTAVAPRASSRLPPIGARVWGFLASSVARQRGVAALLVLLVRAAGHRDGPHDVPAL